jgi:hypothetical protein
MKSLLIFSFAEALIKGHFLLFETRSHVLQFGSTLVTYLIVLLQLKFSVAGNSHIPQNMGSAAQNVSAAGQQ